MKNKREQEIEKQDKRDNRIVNFMICLLLFSIVWLPLSLLYGLYIGLSLIIAKLIAMIPCFIAILLLFYEILTLRLIKGNAKLMARRIRRNMKTYKFTKKKISKENIKQNNRNRVVLVIMKTLFIVSIVWEIFITFEFYQNIPTSDFLLIIMIPIVIMMLISFYFIGVSYKNNSYDDIDVKYVINSCILIYWISIMFLIILIVIKEAGLV